MSDRLPRTEPLDWTDDPAARMVAGIDRMLLGMIRDSVDLRAVHWQRDVSSPDAYRNSIAPNRETFRQRIGLVDERVPSRFEPIGDATASEPGLLARGEGYRVLTVRWPVLRGLWGEGLLLLPAGEPAADVIALPDCEQTPEMVAGLSEGIPPESQYARRLAESGCRVLIPTLVDRGQGLKVHPDIPVSARSHREFLFRMNFEMGRHLIGDEVQEVLAAVDAFEALGDRPCGVIGYAEGGLLALHAAAADERVDVAAVLGYFQPRETVWREPIDRSVWGLLEQFGDAELASLVAPRTLLVEACRTAELHLRDYQNDSQGPTPGDVETPALTDVAAAVERARGLVAGLDGGAIELIGTGDGAPGSAGLLESFLRALTGSDRLGMAGEPPALDGPLPDTDARRSRLIGQLLDVAQRAVDEGERRRRELWAESDLSNAEAFAASCNRYREHFHEEVIGKLPAPNVPLRPRSRKLYELPEFIAYEVVIDVYDDVFAQGILLVPNDIVEGEERPVVVCQHGLEGRPERAAVPEDTAAYRRYGCRLAQRGFVVFAPQNPYLGYDYFRTLQRKAYLLRKTLFSFIVRQHERILDWLGDLPFVDPERIAFYGISYGGKTAMRVPAIEQRYCLSICSGDFNEWIRKCADIRFPNSYLYTNEHEMYEWNLGNTYNYAEMSWLIFPRPFMVERGHHDGCAPDSAVGYEWAKTFRKYNLFGIPERAVIEWFDGPHAIHGVGSFAFLHEWLEWPAGS